MPLALIKDGGRSKEEDWQTGAGWSRDREEPFPPGPSSGGPGGMISLFCRPSSSGGKNSKNSSPPPPEPAARGD